jgi:hypothetical protein
MTPQERIAAKEAEHARRQVEADRNDLAPESLRAPPSPKKPTPPHDAESTR